MTDDVSCWTPSARRSAGTAARSPASARTTSPHTSSRAVVDRATELDPARIDDVFFGDANGAGEDNRNVARMAALLAGLPTSAPGRDGQPAVRVRAGGRHRRQPRRRGRRRLARHRRRRRVDEPRAVGAAEAGQGHSRPHPRRCTRPRWAGGWSTRTCPATGRSPSARRPSCSPRSTASPATRRTSSRSAAITTPRAAWDGRRVRRRGRARARRRARPRRVDPRRHHASRRLARLKPAFRPDGTVTAGNAQPAQRRRRGAARSATTDGAQTAGRAPLARIVSRGVAAVEPQYFGIGPVEAARIALAAGRHRLGRPRAGRAERGVRRAVAGVPRRMARPRPGDRQRARRRDRDRPSAGLLRRAHRRASRARAARPRRRVRPGRDLHRRRPGPRVVLEAA